jgi:hypothetical protein
MSISSLAGKLVGGKVFRVTSHQSPVVSYESCLDLTTQQLMTGDWRLKYKHPRTEVRGRFRRYTSRRGLEF